MNLLRVLLAFALAFLPLAEASAAIVQITVKDAGGTNRNVSVTTNTDITGNLLWNNVICDPTTSTQCASVDASGRQLVTITSGSVASGAYASGAFASGAFASGSVASGAYASGSIGSGAMVDLGAIADAAATVGSTGTLSAKLRLMTTQLDNINTNVQAGTGSTGSAVPSAAIYPGLNVGGTLRGATAVNPSGSIFAQQVDLASIAGTTAASSFFGVGATGAAPPANGAYMMANASGATGGHAAGMIQCDSKATYDASTNGSTRVITGVSGRNIYICGFLSSTGGTATNIKLVEGTKVTNDCDTGAANMSPAFQLAANDKIGMNSAFFNGFKTATTADDVCVNSSAGNAVQWVILYTIL